MKRDLTRSLLYFSPRTVLLLTILLAPLSFMAFKSVTFDEVSHLPAGYSYWKTWSIRYNQQHPPLIKELCALPLLLLGIQGPDSLPENEWVYGRQFLFGDSVDANDAVFWGRFPVILLSVALACLTMIWSESLWGRSAGLLALCLYGFDPTITAHSQVVTTDVGVAFFATHYLFQLRAYLKNPSNLRLIVASVALGLALGAKFSAVVLLPISVCLLFIDLRYLPKATEHTPESLHSLGKKVNWSKLVLQLVFRMTLISVIASAVVWLLYFCPLDPWFYLKGIRSVHQDHPSNSYYYLMGTLQPGNRKYYLLIAWLIKTPLPSLILLTIAIGLFFRGRRAEPLEEAFLLLPSIGFMAFYSFLGDNIGVRYLIPCFPFLFIFASRIFSNAIRSERVPRLLVVALLLWHVAEWISISPDHLSYFNQIAGGATKGVDWLDNSNVDWGQGLFQLRDFVHREQIGDFAFFYFGTGDPTYYGIHGRRIEDFTFMLHPTYGTLVLSAHAIPRTRDILYRAFGDGRSNWLLYLKPRAIVGHSYFVYEIR